MMLWMYIWVVKLKGLLVNPISQLSGAGKINCVAGYQTCWNPRKIMTDFESGMTQRN